MKKHHLSSTNLLHLEGLIHICEHNHHCAAVERRFLWSHCLRSFDKERLPPSYLLVDVVAGQGTCWIKVFVRKRNALHRKWLGALSEMCTSLTTEVQAGGLCCTHTGEGNFGEKTVTEFAEEYTVASQQNLCNFVPPWIIFVFFDGITESIAGGHG